MAKLTLTLSAAQVEKALDNALNPDKELTEEDVPADAKTVGEKFAETLVYRGTLTASDDFNTITLPGVYGYSEGDVPANAPFDTGGITVMVYGDGTQIATGKYEETLKLKIRCGIPETEYWSSWHDIVNNGLVYRRSILAPEDLNDVIDDGIYRISLNSDLELPENTPDDTGGVLMVYSTDDDVVQIKMGASAYGGDSVPSYKYRMGLSDGSSWTAWSAVGELAQETGSSETQAMSQKAVTEAIAAISGDTDVNMIRIFNSMLTNGVFATDDETALAPTAIGGMKVTNNPGTILINGYSKKLAKNTRTFGESDSDRVEVYLFRLDTTTGEISALVRSVIIDEDLILSKEDGAELPIRSGGYYDILIHKTTIPAGTTEITQDMIEDLRANEDYCGFVKLKL